MGRQGQTSSCGAASDQNKMVLIGFNILIRIKCVLINFNILMVLSVSIF